MPVISTSLPPKVAIERMKKDEGREKGKEHRFEKNKDFMEKLRKNFIELSSLSRHHVVIIDGTKSVDEVFENQIKPAFDKFYSERR